MDDLVHLVPPAVVAAQDRTVLVGHLGPGGDDLAHQCTESADVLLGQRPVPGVGEVAVEQGAQVGVERVPVEPGGLLVVGVVGKHPPMLRPEASPGARGRPAHHLGKLIRLVNNEHHRRRHARCPGRIRASGTGSAPGPGPDAAASSLLAVSPRPAPEGSDAELAARMRLAILRLSRRLRQQVAGGVTSSQVSALATVERLGTPTLGELASSEQVQPPSMTKIVVALEAAGLVARQEDDS